MSAFGFRSEFTPSACFRRASLAEDKERSAFEL
jgi:hypothetical protein